jgi:hypothetical protein
MMLERCIQCLRLVVSAGGAFGTTEVRDELAGAYGSTIYPTGILRMCFNSSLWLWQRLAQAVVAGFHFS